MLTQRLFQITSLVVLTTALNFVVYFPAAAEPAASLGVPQAPALPGANLGLSDALGKSNQAVVGTVSSVKAEGVDSRGMTRYVVDVQVTRHLFGIPHVGTDMLEGASPLRCDFVTASPEMIPQDGRVYIFFMSSAEGSPTNRVILKMLTEDAAVDGDIAKFPPKSERLEDILTSPLNIVKGRFVKFERRFELARENGSRGIWVQKYKAVIDVKESLRGNVNPGLVEGDFAYQGSEKKDEASRSRPVPPDMTQDYLFFLWVPEPADHVQGGRAFPKDFIFYLSPGRPSEVRYEVREAFPANTVPEPASSPLVDSATRLPLPGSDLSLTEAAAKAETIVLGRLFEMSAFYGNGPIYNQNDTVQIVKILRGKVGGATHQYVVPIRVGREAPLEMGKQYLFFVSHYGVPLKVAAPDAISAMPSTPRSETKSSSGVR